MINISLSTNDNSGRFVEFSWYKLQNLQGWIQKKTVLIADIFTCHNVTGRARM